MGKRTRDIIIGALAVVATAVALYFGFRGRTEKINLGPYEALGAITAEETAKLLGNKGEVVVMAPDTGDYKNPSVEAELKAFQQTAKQKGVKVITERITINPMMMMATGGGAPPDLFFKALERHQHPAAIVLFFGFPQLSDTQFETLKKINAKTIVASSFHPTYKRLMERQALDLAIVPRTDSSQEGKSTPKNLRELFDQEFFIVTPADASRM